MAWVDWQFVPPSTHVVGIQASGASRRQTMGRSSATFSCDRTLARMC